MIRRHAASFALMTIAMGLGLYAFVDRASVTQSERERRSRNVLPAYRRDEITRLELQRKTGELVLERAGDAGDAPWTIVKPIQERADSHAVDDLLAAFEFATRVRKAPEDAPGLAEPRVHGSMTMGALTFRFALGDDAPEPAGAAYLRVDGEGTFVVSGELSRALQKDVSELRSRTVVPYLSIDLARLSVRGEKSFTLERADDVAFRLPEIGARASRDKLDQVWLALVDLRASAFLDDAEAERALAPELTIEMTPKDASKPAGKLQIGGACPRSPGDVVLVRTSPSRASACVPAGIAKRLSLAPSELADARLFVARLDEVESLELSSESTTIDLARKGSGWTLRRPEPRDLLPDEADMATMLAGAIAHGEGKLVGASFTAKSKAIITRTETHAVETVEIGAGERGEPLARRLADGAVLALDPELARKLRPSLVALRGAAVWSPSVEGASYAWLELECDGKKQRLTHDKRWSFEARAGLPADDAAANEVADSVARVKPDAWIAENDDGGFGFDKPCTLALGVRADGGARGVRLFLGRATESGVYARAEGQNPVFLASRALRDAAARPLADRGALALDPSAPATLERNGKSITLASADAGALFERASRALGALRADDVVHFGPMTDDEGPTSLVVIQGKRVRFGRATLRRDQKMYFAEVSGVPVTYAVAKERVEPLLDPFVP